MMKYEIYRFLHFKRHEWLLLLLIIGLNAGLWIVDLTRKPIVIEKQEETAVFPGKQRSLKKPLPSEADDKKRESNREKAAQSKTYSTQKKNQNEPANPGVSKVKKSFLFDPNTISRDSLLLLGISKRAANNWVKYRQSGGHFYKREDVGKIYGLDESRLEQILPWVRISFPHDKKRPGKKYPIPSKIPVIISINSSDSEDWQKLKGIGPFYSRKITEYRNRLGGFNKVQQLRETPGLPDSVYRKILPFLRIESPPTPLNINTADYLTLLKHPYINKKQAKLIIKYRKQHGSFKEITDLLHIRIIDTAFIRRIKPYFYTGKGELVKK